MDTDPRRAVLSEPRDQGDVLKFAVAAASLLALGAAACGELDDVTTAKDLRVLGVKCEPAGFLVDPANPGAGTDDAWRTTITALVVDPLAPGGMVEVSAVGCPDYIDAMTSAQLRGPRLCPAPGTAVLVPELDAVTLPPADAPAAFAPTQMDGYQYEPTLMFGLTARQVGAFFMTGSTGIPAVDKSIALNRDFGLPAIVNLSFALNGERAEAIKRVVYWPQLVAGQEPNKNPVFGDPADPNVKLRLYSQRDEVTGNPDTEITNLPPTISISLNDKLYVDPVYGDSAELYPLNVNNV